jgi:hypothetical protein
MSRQESLHPYKKTCSDYSILSEELTKQSLQVQITQKYQLGELIRNLDQTPEVQHSLT